MAGRMRNSNGTCVQMHAHCTVTSQCIEHVPTHRCNLPLYETPLNWRHLTIWIGASHIWTMSGGKTLADLQQNDTAVVSSITQVFTAHDKWPVTQSSWHDH
jgi:hypothetical protein